MAPQHPADRDGDRPGRFTRLAEHASNFTSSPGFFGVCLVLVAGAITAHALKLPTQWLLVVGEAMSAVSLLLLALLKNSERRAEHAIQRKLDAIAAALLEIRREEPGAASEELRKAISMEKQT
ncbi:MULTISPECIES: low affinity iron permease family protein [Streptomyces]|uniref:Low affinity iron permease family protein n=1 Tax=Streptomyces liliifuscus TaxID=2797636 RepID=A0A7T7RGF6_9ACTN|nr:low affinity iron permease family protein [Streptomyces liliifuscus]QQM45719.1 low affinity iron permease family protein [Streptomyces liliifuscus]